MQFCLKFENSLQTANNCSVFIAPGRLAKAVTGTNIHGTTTGTGGSSYELATLLKGGPALTVAQFASYKPTTTVGVSLTITAPTGLYNADKLLNLGSNRWSLKPEIAVSHPFGPQQTWEFDAYANAYFYTDNTSYHGVEILRQQALPGLEGHISYSFRTLRLCNTRIQQCRQIRHSRSLALPSRSNHPIQTMLGPAFGVFFRLHETDWRNSRVKNCRSFAQVRGPQPTGGRDAFLSTRK